MRVGKSIQFEFGEGIEVDFDEMTRGFYEELNGIRITKMGEGYAEAEVEVVQSLINSGRTLHGGVVAAVADTIAIYGCAHTYKVPSLATVNLNVSYFRPVKSGIVTAKGRMLSKGKNISIWKVDVVDEDSNSVAEAMVTCAIGK
jgi:uncharacterized protein (TIGR00369 family)